MKTSTGIVVLAACLTVGTLGCSRSESPSRTTAGSHVETTANLNQPISPRTPEEETITKNSKHISRHLKRSLGAAESRRLGHPSKPTEAAKPSVAARSVKTKRVPASMPPATMVPESACRNVGPHDHPPFLRSDIAYGVTGVDCQGNMVRSTTKIDRSLASEKCPSDPHGHPLFMRSDLAYSLEGRDCAGSLPSPLNMVHEPAR